MKVSAMDEITININIMDRPYRLSVARADEEMVRKAATLVNERVRFYAKHYAYKNDQDLLAMTALQLAAKVVKNEKENAFKDQHLERRLNEMNALLSDQLA